MKFELKDVGCIECKAPNPIEAADFSADIGLISGVEKLKEKPDHAMKMVANVLRNVGPFIKTVDVVLDKKRVQSFDDLLNTASAFSLLTQFAMWFVQKVGGDDKKKR